MRPPLVSCIKADPSIEAPYVIVRDYSFTHMQVWEVRGMDGQQAGDWYVTFNGNSKQRRQQQRKMIRELNQ